MNITSSMNAAGFINRMMGLSQLKQANQMAKLSSGFRINTGQDAPADLVISEQLRAQSYGTQQAIRNTQEVGNALSIAEGGLGSMADSLRKMKGLAVHALNSGITTPGQVNADQAELDSLLNTLQRIAGTTNYAGQNLLSGAQDFSRTVNDPDALLAPESFQFQRVNGTTAGDVTVSFAGGAANQAEKAQLASGAGTADAAGRLTASQDFTVTGTKGGRSFAFEAGTSLEEVAAQINQSADSTGVRAEVVRADPNDPASAAQQVRLVSEEYGSAQFVRVEQRTGSLWEDRVQDNGQDATVQVNGVSVKANGLEVQYDDGLTRGSFRLNEATAAQAGYHLAQPTDATEAAQAGVKSVSGGMTFQLGGGAGGQNRERFGLSDFSLANLGRVTVGDRSYSMLDLFAGGPASLAANPEAAMAVIDQAIQDVSAGRGQIGAYQANTLQTNINNLQVELQNITATESDIRDTDMAASITEMLLERIREQAGVKVWQASKVNAQSTAKLLMGGLG